MSAMQAQPVLRRAPAVVVDLIEEPYTVCLVRTLMEADPQLSFYRAFQIAQQRIGDAA